MDPLQIKFKDSKIFTKIIFPFEIPLINYSASIRLGVFLNFLALFLLGYGSYALIIKPLNFIFLDKAYAPYSFIYILAIIFNSLHAKLLNASSSQTLHSEFIELFIYVLLLTDVILKKEKMNFGREWRFKFLIDSELRGKR